MPKKEVLKLFIKGNDLYITLTYRLDSALLRQAVYATLRLGIYFNLSAHIKDNINGGKNLSAW